MAKFYVCSGNLRDVVDAPDRETAVRKALDRVPLPVMLSSVMWVNERGFEHEDTEAEEFLPTINFMLDNE